MAGITQNGQKSFIIIVVPQLRDADGPGFLKKNNGQTINKMRTTNNKEKTTTAYLLLTYVVLLSRTKSYY